MGRWGGPSLVCCVASGIRDAVHFKRDCTRDVALRPTRPISPGRGVPSLWSLRLGPMLERGGTARWSKGPSRLQARSHLRPCTAQTRHPSGMRTVSNPRQTGKHMAVHAPHF